MTLLSWTHGDLARTVSLGPVTNRDLLPREVCPVRHRSASPPAPRPRPGALTRWTPARPARRRAPAVLASPSVRWSAPSSPRSCSPSPSSPAPAARDVVRRVHLVRVLPCDARLQQRLTGRDGRRRRPGVVGLRPPGRRKPRATHAPQPDPRRPRRPRHTETPGTHRGGPGTTAPARRLPPAVGSRHPVAETPPRHLRSSRRRRPPRTPGADGRRGARTDGRTCADAGGGSSAPGRPRAPRARFWPWSTPSARPPDAARSSPTPVSPRWPARTAPTCATAATSTTSTSPGWTPSTARTAAGLSARAENIARGQHDAAAVMDVLDEQLRPPREHPRLQPDQARGRRRRGLRRPLVDPALRLTRSTRGRQDQHCVERCLSSSIESALRPVLIMERATQHAPDRATSRSGRCMSAAVTKQDAPAGRREPVQPPPVLRELPGRSPCHAPSYSIASRSSG